MMTCFCLPLLSVQLFNQGNSLKNDSSEILRLKQSIPKFILILISYRLPQNLNPLAVFMFSFIYFLLYYFYRGFRVWTTYRNTIRGPPLTCVQQSAGDSYEGNTGKKMDKEQRNTEASSAYIPGNNFPPEKNSNCTQDLLIREQRVWGSWRSLILLSSMSKLNEYTANTRSQAKQLNLSC